MFAFYVECRELAETELTSPLSISLDPAEQFGQTLLQTLGNSLYIQKRNVPDPSFDTAVVRAMQSASFRSFFLIDLLLLAYATDCATKTDADIEGHCVRCSPHHSRCVNIL